MVKPVFEIYICTLRTCLKQKKIHHTYSAFNDLNWEIYTRLKAFGNILDAISKFILSLINKVRSILTGAFMEDWLYDTRFNLLSEISISYLKKTA